MFNRTRTLETFGYDLDLSQRRRNSEDFKNSGGLNKKELLVVDNCPICGKERIIKLRASRKNKPCSKCFHNSEKMQDIKHAQVGRVFSEETREKMSKNNSIRNGGINYFKGKHHTEEAKNLLSSKTKEYLNNLPEDVKTERYVKSSCKLRGVPVEDFDGWSSEESTRIRGSQEYKIFEKAVLERDNHRCVVPGCLHRKISNLTVHHKDGFHWCLDRRFDMTNGATLCKTHHLEFHDKYLRRNNTEAQFDEWIKKFIDSGDKKVEIIVIAGITGSGKSWICNQLRDKFNYIPYDGIPKEQHLLKILEKSRENNKPVLYDPFRKGSSFYKRYKDFYDVKFLVIVETAEVIWERLKSRGSKMTLEEVQELVIKNNRNLKHSTFSGTSIEILNYLRDLDI